MFGTLKYLFCCYFFFFWFWYKVKPWTILMVSAYLFSTLANFNGCFKVFAGIFILIVNIFCVCSKKIDRKVPPSPLKWKKKTLCKSNVKFMFNFGVSLINGKFVIIDWVSSTAQKHRLATQTPTNSVHTHRCVDRNRSVANKIADLMSLVMSSLSLKAHDSAINILRQFGIQRSYK